MTQKNQTISKGWTTCDELKFISHIADPEKNTIEERLEKLRAWIKAVKSRRWGTNIDVEQCEQVARQELETATLAYLDSPYND